MKRILVVSLVGCLLGANQLFGSMVEFNKLAKQGAFNKDRLLTIYSQLTKPEDIMAAKTHLRRLRIDWTTAPGKTEVVRKTEAVVKQQAEIAVPQVERDAQDFIKRLSASGTRAEELQKIIDEAEEFLNRPPSETDITKESADRLRAAIAAAERRRLNLATLYTMIEAGRKTTDPSVITRMEIALAEYRRLEPADRATITNVEGIIADAREAAQLAAQQKKQQEQKVSKEEKQKEAKAQAGSAIVGEFRALTTQDALNKKIEELTLAGTTLSAIEAAAVKAHINGLTTLTADDKTALLTGLQAIER